MKNMFSGGNPNTKSLDKNDKSPEDTNPNDV